MRNVFAKAWAFAMGPAQSPYMRALHHLRERYPDKETPKNAPHARAQAAIMGFIVATTLVIWAWIAHFMGAKPQ